MSSTNSFCAPVTPSNAPHCDPRKKFLEKTKFEEIKKMGKNVNYYYYYYYGIINIITRSPGAHSGRRMIWCDSAL